VPTEDHPEIIKITLEKSDEKHIRQKEKRPLEEGRSDFRNCIQTIYLVPEFANTAVTVGISKWALS